MALGLLVSLALVVAAVRSERVRWPVLAFVSLVQTVPSLALLALFYPLLLALSASPTSCSAPGSRRSGFLPSLLALALYSMLPIVRNGVAGILEYRPGARRGGARRRHDRLAAALARGAAAGDAAHHGGRSHGRRLGHRRGDAVDARRPGQPGQLHFLGPAGPGLGVGPVRLRRGRRRSRSSSIRCLARSKRAWHAAAVGAIAAGVVVLAAGIAAAALPAASAPRPRTWSAGRTSPSSSFSPSC